MTYRGEDRHVRWVPLRCTGSQLHDEVHEVDAVAQPAEGDHRLPGQQVPHRGCTHTEKPFRGRQRAQNKVFKLVF